MVVGFARLTLHILEVYATTVDAYRRTRLHSLRRYAVTRDALREVKDGRFGASASRYLLPSHVHQSVKERARCDDYSLCTERHAPDRLHAYRLSVLDKQLAGFVLPDVEVVHTVETGAPFPYKLSSVALCTRAPYCRTFTAVEHTELNGRGVSDESHLASKSVNLAYYLSFGDAAHGGVATHLSDLIHVHRHKARLRSHSCSRACRFTSGVTTTNDYNVVFEIHISVCDFRWLSTFIINQHCLSSQN